MTRVGGRDGAGRATEDRVAKVQARGPAELRPPGAQVSAGWGTGTGLGGSGGHALTGRLGPGAIRVLESRAGTPGLLYVLECPEWWRQRLPLGAESFRR